ncbi:MAG: flagellar basal body rod protein FlgB [Candidatus Velthaea sp.]
MMGDISFGQTIGMLKNAMDGASESHATIANNIANVNTPNFRRTDVTFKEALARTEATAGGSDPEQLNIVTTSERHIALDGAQAPEPFAVSRTVADSQQMRVDGSNVDVDQEMAKLSINSGYAQTMAQLLQNQFARMRQAITERS